jgi:hypothetical protein
MYKIKSLIISIAITLTVGCGSSSVNRCGCNLDEVDKRPSLDVDCSGSLPITFNEEEFSNGVVQNNIDIAIEENNVDMLRATISKDTRFEDENKTGKYTETTPRYFINQSYNDENVIKSELKFVDTNCNKVFPTKPIHLSINVSAIALSNDPIIIGMPDGSFFTEIVDKNGYISFEIYTEMFIEKNDILVIVISLLKQTGAEGGN